MAKLLERPAEQLPTESNTLVHEAPKRTELPPTAPLVVETPPQRRPIRWMRWLAVFVVLIVGAATVAVLVTRDDGSELATRATPRSALNGEVWAEPVARPTPRSALNGEVWAEPVTRPTPRSALNGEVWAEPVTRPTPRSAVNGEVWAEVETTNPPVSAIGGEAWSDSA